MERTLVILKPDAVERGLVGQITARFEARGFTIRGMKLARLDRELAEKNYAVHKDKPFYEQLIQFITSGPVVLMVLEGEKAISVVRTMMGATFCTDAEPGTIRGDFGLGQTENMIHGSDSPETAKKEIALFFSEEELVGQSRTP
jgi:nucleoside-diphosphate kinase